MKQANMRRGHGLAVRSSVDKTLEELQLEGDEGRVACHPQLARGDDRQRGRRRQ